jgi:hypothetical protein
MSYQPTYRALARNCFLPPAKCHGLSMQDRQNLMPLGSKQAALRRPCGVDFYKRAPSSLAEQRRCTHGRLARTSRRRIPKVVLWQPPEQRCRSRPQPVSITPPRLK